MKKKIAAVVVTYNRSKELIKNIQMLLQQEKQFDAIYVINNNSTDDTVTVVKQIDNKLIKLLNLTENVGGAGGFYYGTMVAYNAGYDYIVLMDDDGKPYNDKTIQELYTHAEQISNPLVMINSLVFENENKMSFGLGSDIANVKDAKLNAINGRIEGLINPFNGTLISKSLIKEIGFPNGKFFIKGDEADYRRRAEQAGAYIATIVDSYYYHPSIVKESRKVCRGVTVIDDLEVPWKEYYRARNYTFVYKKANRRAIVKRVLKSILIRDENWQKRISMIWFGYRDGMNNRMGKIVQPGQLDYKKGK